jgi:hypothetical protein
MNYKKRIFLLKATRTVCFVLGSICFLLNSLVYLYPEEVATPPVEVAEKIFFYVALHSLFIVGVLLGILGYFINKKKSNIEKLELEIKVFATTCVSD